MLTHTEACKTARKAVWGYTPGGHGSIPKIYVTCPICCTTQCVQLSDHVTAKAAELQLKHNLIFHLKYGCKSRREKTSSGDSKW